MIETFFNHLQKRQVLEKTFLSKLRNYIAWEKQIKGEMIIFLSFFLEIFDFYPA